MSTPPIPVKQGKEGRKEEGIHCSIHTAKEMAIQWKNVTRSMAIQDQISKEVDQGLTKVQTMPR